MNKASGIGQIYPNCSPMLCDGIVLLESDYIRIRDSIRVVFSVQLSLVRSITSSQARHLPLINLTNQQTLPREDNGSNPSTVVARFGTEEGRICKDNQQTLPCLGRIMGQIPGLSWPDFAKKKAAGARRRLGVASGTAYRI